MKRETEQVNFGNAKWIWAENNRKENDWVVFKKCFCVDKIPEKAVCELAVDTKYWFYVNGKEVVYEGGLFGESLKDCGYADNFDISNYLQVGENNLTVIVWHYGKGGRNNTRCEFSGMIFRCEELGIYSNSDFMCARHEGFYIPENINPARLYGGFSIGYDAEKSGLSEAAAFCNSLGFSNAIEYREGNVPYKALFARPVPLIKTKEIFVGDLKRQGSFVAEKGDLLSFTEAYTVDLPYAMTFTPILKFYAKGGEKLRLRTDRYLVNGGPGDETNSYEGQCMEYTAAKGDNCFEMPGYLYGEKLIITTNSEINGFEISIRESMYSSEITGKFECNDVLLNKLVEKSARTLTVCMRDNFMDCPDRERGQWIGDVSAQVAQVFYLLDKNGAALVKKAVYDFISLRHGDVLVGNVPGENSGELPPQSLCAISEWGLIAQYYEFTHDAETLEFCYEPIVNYLKLWDFDNDKGLLPRNGDWRWFDHLYNIDDEVLEHAWYYSAVKFALRIAKITGDDTHTSFLNSREEGIRNCFGKYWNGYAYSSGKLIDDRANAMAVLSGLCPSENYKAVSKILLTVFNCTVYMENFVLMALCEMGFVEEAYKRMMARYYQLAINENSTLWEDFYILGTKNHAWSGAPATIAFKYFLGLKINPDDGSYTINPVEGLFDYIKAEFMLNDGLVKVKTK